MSHFTSATLTPFLLEWPEDSQIRCAPGAPFLQHHYAVEEGLRQRLLETILRRECPDASIPELLLANDLDLLALLLL